MKQKFPLCIANQIRFISGLQADMIKHAMKAPTVPVEFFFRGAAEAHKIQIQLLIRHPEWYKGAL